MNSESVYHLLESKKSELGVTYAVLLIMFRGGFRVSEVLKLKPQQIINSTDIYINASKGSRSRRVHVPEIKKYLERWKKNQTEPFKHISRFQVYRTCKRLGLVIDNGDKKNNSVTHSMRKVFVQGNFESSGNIEVAAELTGHKSSKSTEYYVKKK